MSKLRKDDIKLIRAETPVLAMIQAYPDIHSYGTVDTSKYVPPDEETKKVFEDAKEASKGAYLYVYSNTKGQCFSVCVFKERDGVYSVSRREVETDV